MAQQQDIGARVEVAVENGALILNGLPLPHLYVDKQGDTYVIHSGYGKARKTIEFRGQDELDKWVPLIANVMATQSGFTGFGPDAAPLWAGTGLGREATHRA